MTPIHKNRRFEHYLPLFVLIHSPVVGPLTWQPVVRFLEKKGYKAIAPTLDHATASYWSHYASLIARSIGNVPENTPLVLVAHSAAGLLIPAAKEALSDRTISGYIFVDASLPRPGATLADLMPANVGIGIEQLRAQAKNDYLPPLGEEWGEEMGKQLIPDDSLRERFRCELPSIPLALYEECLPVASDWREVPCSYLRFSISYVDTEQKARQIGCITREISGQHFHMLVEPNKVAEELIELAKIMMHK